ncbi:YadA-like family protein [Bartonella schoenbuchensis]|uniref:Surface protein/Bartonella adhesin n=1 Tax=Bartonella schoenbuchensis (strain DSM 13525 / NCTC 13165 / R1) TaxID=687861 RepID=E6YZ43_BARSR
MVSLGAVVSLGATVMIFLSSVFPVFATDQGVKYGSDAYAKNQQDTAIGREAQAKGDGATAVGSFSQAGQQNSTAVGRYAKANGYGGTAIGTLATTDKFGGTTLGTAIGYSAESLVWGGVALGSHSKADVKEGTAGYNPESGVTSLDRSLAWKSTRGAVSIGDVTKEYTRQIVGVAAGTQDTDAVNVAQLKALRKWVEDKDGIWKFSVNSKDTTRINYVKRLDLIEGKNIEIVKNGNKVTFGLTESVKLKGIEIENAALKINSNGIDAGNKNITNVAEGKITEESAEAVSGKQLYKMGNDISQYLGGGATFREDGFFGPQYILSKVSTDGSVKRADFNDVGSAFIELDANIKNVNNHLKYVSGNFREAIDKISEDLKHNTVTWSESDKAFVALHTENGKRKNSKLTFLMDGDITPNSTDAVTGRQLWKTNKRIKSLKDKVNNVIDRVNTLTDGVVTYDKDEYGKKANSITLVGGKEGEPVLIDNVANGEIEEGSKQAVNGGQLHDYVKEQTQLALADANKYTDEKIGNMVNDAVAQANAYTDMKFEALNYRVESVQKEARQAAAIGLAVANLHYIETPGMLSIAFGSGVWRGQSALAFGTGYMSEDGKMRSNFSVTTSGGHWGVGAGLSLALK